MHPRKVDTKIMLVDDDPVVNFIHTKLIAAVYDCEVGAYTEPKEALEYLKNEGTVNEFKIPSLLLLDINMPVMNGWTFLTEFEKLPTGFTRHCRVFLLTSSVDRDDETRCKQFHSVRGFLSKPLTKDKVRELITDLS